MKRCTKPTLRQKKIMLKNRMDPKLFLVVRDYPDRIDCIRSDDGMKKTAFAEVMKI